MMYREAADMTAQKKADRHRQWAANAMADAMRTESEADRETLMMIARQHLAMARQAEHSATRAVNTRRRRGLAVRAQKTGEDTHSSEEPTARSP
jgi:hypothetical protein